MGRLSFLMANEIDSPSGTLLLGGGAIDGVDDHVWAGGRRGLFWS